LGSAWAGDSRFLALLVRERHILSLSKTF